MNFPMFRVLYVQFMSMNAYISTTFTPVLCINELNFWQTSLSHEWQRFRDGESCQQCQPAVTPSSEIEIIGSPHINGSLARYRIWLPHFFRAVMERTSRSFSPQELFQIVESAFTFKIHFQDNNNVNIMFKQKIKRCLPKVY